MFSFQLVSVRQAIIECQALFGAEETEINTIWLLAFKAHSLVNFYLRSTTHISDKAETDYRERYFGIENKGQLWKSPTSRPGQLFCLLQDGSFRTMEEHKRRG